MKYDFESIIDRHGLDALAVDPDPESIYRKGIKLKKGITDHIPMWIADMNFATYPGIQEAVAKRLAHPCFGYFSIRDEYFDAIIKWQRRRNGVRTLKKECIGYENGVLGGVSSALRTLLPFGGKVLVHSPTYIGFTHVFDDAGFTPVHSPLIKDAKGIWCMDYEDMEQKIIDNKIKVAIFCSPHNPTGRVWDKYEIERAMELFKKFDVTVISDEIWSDLILNGNQHIPTQSVSRDAKMRTIALYAPSKTFSLAGFIGSYHIVYNPKLREQLMRTEKSTFYNDINVLSMYALIGGFNEGGEEWLDELVAVLSDNADYACKYIKRHFKGVKFSKPQGTYMLFIDCSGWLNAHNMTQPELLKLGYEAGVDWQDGEAFLCKNCIRLNLALPQSRLKEAFKRLDKYVFNA